MFDFQNCKPMIEGENQLFKIVCLPHIHFGIHAPYHAYIYRIALNQIKVNK